MTKNKHLTLSQRIEIESKLNSSIPFRTIGRQLGKDPSTISKEIKSHLVFKKTGCFGGNFNDCTLRFSCSLKHLCSNPSCKKKYCKSCPSCFKYCTHYVKEHCPRLQSYPYVCNGCSKRTSCTLEKRLYSAKAAQEEYETVRSESRCGLSISKEEALALDSLVSPLILRGQSIHHICATRPDLIMLSERTLYSYVDAGIFSSKNLDLPRKVRYRQRKRTSPFKIDKKCRLSRTYLDFLDFLSKYPDTPIVQMDSVEGRKGGKVLLTIHFVESQFMLAFLRDSNNSESVVNVFEKLYLLLNPTAFLRLFPVLLGDNGSEFSNPKAIEFDMQGNPRTKVFYCDPSAPHQKGAAENNHEFIRRVIPKGTSLDNLCQDQIDLLMNHINSYKRKKLGDLSPYEVFKNFHGEEVLTRLNAKYIPPEEILLLPRLLK